MEEGYLRRRECKAMLTVVIITTFLCISSVASQITIEQSPKNVTATVGESVVLTCVFSEPVDCNWLKDDQPYRIKPADGNTYTGDSSTGEGTRDCSIRISALTQDDFAKWSCSTYGSKGVSAVSTEAAWITKRVTPTPPVILFNNKSVSEIKLPSAEPARENMVCVSERGNPAADLTWETNGTPYLGRLEKVEVGPNLYTVQLFWDRGGGWQIFDNSTEVICKAKHPGFTNTMAARVEFKRNYAPKTVKVWAEGFNDRDVAIRRGESVLLACISDGQPAPTYTWELWSEEDKTWKLYNNSHNEQNITVTIELLGKYRCKASNDLNKYTPTTSLNQLVVSESKAEGASTGLIVGIVIGCTLLVTIIVLIVIYLKRKQKTTTPEKDGHAGVQDGRDPEAVDDTTEKTALSDPSYEPQQNGQQDDKLNGKTETSPIKVEGNVNKSCDEVVYAQLDLSHKDAGLVRTPSEPEKTEYAEIRFNRDNNQNSHPA